MMTTQLPHPNGSSWFLFQDLCTKSCRKRTDGTRPYLAEELVDGQLGDLSIDLRTMLMQCSATLDRGDDDDDDDGSE